MKTIAAAILAAILWIIPPSWAVGVLFFMISYLFVEKFEK